MLASTEGLVIGSREHRLQTPPMNVKNKVTRLWDCKVGRHPSLSQEGLISPRMPSFCWSLLCCLSSVIPALCLSRPQQSCINHVIHLHWIFSPSSYFGLNDTFGKDSQMYIRIERGRKWPGRWVFMHYRSLYERPESHSATINQDEGPTGSLPARK